MAASVAALLQQAVQMHRQGRLDDAEQLCQAALGQNPKSVEALHLLGLISMQQGRIEEAAGFVSTAVKRNPASCDALMLLGSIKLRLGQIEEALSCFDRAIVVQPKNVDALYNRAVALDQAGRPQQAVAAYDRLVRDQPAFAPGWFNRGVLLARLGRAEDAAVCFDRVLALVPNHPDALNNRGNALAMLGRHGEALASFDRLLALKPDYVGALSNRAISLYALGRHDDALADCARVLSIQPTHVNALVTRGNVLHALARYEEALSAYDRAIAITPADIETINNRGISLLELGRFDEALAAGERAVALDPAEARGHVMRAKALQALARYNEAITGYAKALALKPDVADAAFNMRVCQLWLGRFEEGWSTHKPQFHRYAQPRWNGGRVHGTLLIWCDEGVGDQIIYAGAVPELTGRADSVVMEVDHRLVDLFSRSFPDVAVIAAGQALYGGQIDAQEVTAGLARHLRRTWEAFPQREQGFLKPDEQRTHDLRKRLHNDQKPVIGLTWISRNRDIGRFKSARLRDFEPLLRLPGYRFVDLQYGDTAEERAEVEREFGVWVEHLADVDNMNDLDGLAALTAACDAVLTVSSTTAHMAGAIGTRTFVMVPYGRGHLWYWFIDRPMSPWYPRLHVRRQQQGQSWSELVGALVPEVTAAASSSCVAPSAEVR